MIKHLLRQILLRRGYLVDFSTSNDDLKSFFPLVFPVAIDRELVRVGGNGDGGYLLPEHLDGIAACFSPGVAATATFEQMLAGYGVRCFMADYSVNKAPIQNALFHFEKKFIGCADNSSYMRLKTWVEKSVPSDAGDLLLQMDIEGGEYQVILETPIDVLQRFRMLVIEFHALQLLFDEDSFPILRSVFQKLHDVFTVVHNHPNNCKPILSNGTYAIPPVIELTFYRNDYVNRVDRQLKFPHALDQTNVPENQDFALPACWWQRA